MAKAPKKPPPDEDEGQSRRFIETAKALEADGELSPTDAEGVFERILRKAAPVKRRGPS